MINILRPLTKILLLIVALLGSGIRSTFGGDVTSAAAVLAPTFYRAINLNGAAVTIDGNNWEASSGAPNFSYSGEVFANQNVALVPATDANRATMIRSSIWGNYNLNVTSVPNGSYDIYMYVWEDNNPATYTISIEGVERLSNYESGPAGSWKKLGPFRTVISDGAINISAAGNSAVASGLEIWTAVETGNQSPVVTNPLLDQSATQGMAFSYSFPTYTFTDPDVSTVLTYTADQSNGSPLPSWLTFNSSTRAFSGTPGLDASGTFDIRVTASDGSGGSVSDSFTLSIASSGASVFYRGINLNGSALSIDGNNWLASSGDANFTYNTDGGAFANQGITLIPATDANRETMIRSSIYGNANLTISSIPTGTYDIFVYVWEDTGPQTFSFAIEGAVAVSNYNSGVQGTWSKLGPFRKFIGDGAINISNLTWMTALSGIEIRSVPSAGVYVTGISVSPESLTLMAGQTSPLTAAIAPANATNPAITWNTSNPAVATVNSAGVVTAVSEGAAIITASTVEGGFTDQTTITVEEISTPGDVVSHYAFQYKYDGRKRMTHKKVPGADWAYMVYDERDRLVMTQDGNQRVKAQPEWTFTKYDALNRPILTGIYIEADTATRDQEDMQTKINTFYANAEGEDWFESEGGNELGYTNRCFPDQTDESKHLTVTYYDDYSFKSLITTANDYKYDNTRLVESGSDKGQPEQEFNRVQGQVTGSRVKNLDSNEWMWSVNYYDDRYRVIQVTADNNKGGIDKTTSVYDFVGKVLRTKTDHSISGGTPVATSRKMTYDHVGRLLETEHRTNNGPAVTLAKNEYNELGQLITKNLHSENGSTYKQQVDYRYNIRGWLTRINDSNLSAMDGGAKDYFGMELAYENNIGVGGQDFQYNGNISAIKYSTNQGLGFNNEELEIFEPTERGYVFQYDAMNRLNSATHKENTVAWTSSLAYHEDGIDYDLNGNIMHLNRKGEQGVGMDELNYHYKGNQLLYVKDETESAEGFNDGNTTRDDYLYDENGNMVTDKNKDIATIEYNYLNLPNRVVKSSGEYVKYIYNAAGVKLSQQVYNASNQLQKHSDYLGEFFYENDTLKFVNHEEGRIVMTEANPEYQYFLKDHLGNNRITFTTKNEPETFDATLDTGKETEEQNRFGAYNSYTNQALDPTPAESAGDKILILNGSALMGSNNGQVGLTRSFAVAPGDVVSVSVNAKYNASSGQGNLTGFASALTQAFLLTPGPAPIEGITPFEALNAFGTLIAEGGRDEDDNLPQGFLNMLVFDKAYNLVDASYQQVGTSSTLTASLEIRQAGYVYVFLSNDGTVQQEIGFDNYSLTHEHSDVIQQEEYIILLG